ncbi:MAG: Mrp/NBP35 family ATP-binding protein [Myxococcota bacterium]
MIENVKKILLVASGKGGVGKSTVATNLAQALSKSGHVTGLVDVDIYGPSLPTMLGAVDPPKTDGKKIYPAKKFGLKLMSIGYMVEPEQALVWRGPMLAGAALQLFNDVDWGTLDYLVVDLPPGTGDIQLSLSQQLKVTGAVLVTTPQQVAVADVVRAKAMFDKVRISSLGVVENMSHFIAPDTGTRYDIFGSGGGERVAADLEIPLIGRIPIEPAVRECGDGGEPVVRAYPNSDSARAFMALAEEVDLLAQAAAEAREKKERGRSILPIIGGG